MYHCDCQQGAVVPICWVPNKPKIGDFLSVVAVDLSIQNEEKGFSFTNKQRIEYYHEVLYVTNHR